MSQASSTVSIDLQGLEFIDCSAFAVLLEAGGSEGTNGGIIPAAKPA